MPISPATRSGYRRARSNAIQPPIELPPGATDVTVTFAPTEHEDHTFDLELESTGEGVTFVAAVAGTGGAEAGCADGDGGDGRRV